MAAELPRGGDGRTRFVELAQEGEEPYRAYYVDQCDVCQAGHSWLKLLDRGRRASRRFRSARRTCGARESPSTSTTASARSTSSAPEAE